MVEVKRQTPHLSGTLVIASLVCCGLLVADGLLSGRVSDRFYYIYMIWNLFLGWLPLLFMLSLNRMLKHKRWSSYQGIALSVLWLGFLPNSFYMVTDYIHLAEIPSKDLVLDSTMLTAFVLTGLVLGFASLYLFHIELRKRIPMVTANRIVAAVLFLASFAIYLGRDLRWNSWDLLINPAILAFDIIDQLLSKADRIQMLTTTLSFFVLLGMFYIVTWHVVRAARATAPPRVVPLDEVPPAKK